jgi:hypothetical protein
VLSKVLMAALASSGGSIEVERLRTLKISGSDPLQFYGESLDTRPDFTDSVSIVARFHRANCTESGSGAGERPVLCRAA